MGDQSYQIARRDQLGCSEYENKTRSARLAQDFFDARQAPQTESFVFFKDVRKNSWTEQPLVS